MALSPAQCRAGRALVKLTQTDLGAAAMVAKKTITDFEMEANSLSAELEALRVALEAAGVEFIAQNGGSAGVRLKKI